MSLRVDTHRQGETAVVRLEGELDHHNADMLKKEMEQLIEEEGCLHLVLSLQRLTFMDSSGLGVFLGRYKQIKNKGGRMVVCGVSRPMYRLFEMSGLFKILEIVDSEDQALSSLGVVS